jgi:hypothetical protein
VILWASCFSTSLASNGYASEAAAARRRLWTKRAIDATAIIAITTKVATTIARRAAVEKADPLEGVADSVTELGEDLTV